MHRDFKSVVLAFLVGLAASSFAQSGLSSEVAELLTRAKAGDMSAQFHLANAYDSGRGAPRDGKEAMRWYAAAAEQGDAEAQNSVGSGLQAEKRYSEALVWYEKASLQNHALATNNLAYLHDLGLGVAQDRQKAFHLYSQAANLGWAEAMWNLSNMYGAGQLGQSPDLLSACTWVFRAQRFAAANDTRLQTEIRRIVPFLERKLSLEQMASCRAQAAAWHPRQVSDASVSPR